MALNPNIILQGQGVNALGAIQAGNQAAAQTNQIQRQNALSGFMQQNGQAVMQGDPQALGQYAALAGPEAALGVQRDRQAMARTDQVMRFADTAEGRAVAQHAATMAEAERMASARQIEQALKQGVSLYQTGDIQGINALLSQAGEQPISDLSQFPAVAAKYSEVFDMLTNVRDFNAGPDNGFRIATPQEASQYGAQAGQFGPDGRFYPINPPSGMELSMGPDGTVRLVQGAGAGSNDGRMQPSSPEAMLSTIDSILTDPALDTSTGVLSPLQSIPGTPQRRFGTKSEQLQGQAFLQAFESLKGAGQITEIEGAKATQAIGRLDTAQSAKDYREALTELRGVLQSAVDRKNGVLSQQTQAAPTETPSWMLNTSPSDWTEEQMIEAERIWGIGQ